MIRNAGAGRGSRRSERGGGAPDSGMETAVLIRTLTRELSAQREMIDGLRRTILHLHLLLGVNRRGLEGCGPGAVTADAMHEWDDLDTAKLAITNRFGAFRMQ